MKVDFISEESFKRVYKQRKERIQVDKMVYNCLEYLAENYGDKIVNKNIEEKVKEFLKEKGLDIRTYYYNDNKYDYIMKKLNITFRDFDDIEGNISIYNGFKDDYTQRTYKDLLYFNANIEDIKEREEKIEQEYQYTKENYGKWNKAIDTLIEMQNLGIMNF